MKKKNNKIKIFIILLLLLVTTGCTQTLMDKDNKAVKNEITGQTLTKNIICQPTNKHTIDIYQKYWLIIFFCVCVVLRGGAPQKERGSGTSLSKAKGSRGEVSLLSANPASPEQETITPHRVSV